MTKPVRIASILLAVLVCLAALSALLLSRVDPKPLFEAVASEATGLEATVNGSVSVRLFPTPKMRLRQLTLRNQQAQIASVGTADVGVAWWPLLRRRVRITRLALHDLNVEIERDRKGRFNFAKPPSAKPPVPAMSLGRVSITKASFRYTNRQSDKEVKATDCSVDSDAFRLGRGDRADIMKNLSLTAHVVCAELRNDLFVGTDVDFEIQGERGRFDFAPWTMRILGGKGAGTVLADFTGTMPAYRVRYAVTRLHVNDLFGSLASGKAGEGFLDFSADLSMHGFDADEWTRTARGEASLHGENLELAIGDLDHKLDRYESSQNFNLVDVGAFFIAGPLGTVVTKGYDFATIFRGAQGSTHVRRLLSHWRVEHGIAHAKDVAMATRENRLVLKGALDFVHREFDEVTVAFVDDRGCALVEQKIVGPFSEPDVQDPNVLIAMIGPVTSLIGKMKKMVGMECEVLYEGSIAP